MTDLLRTAPGHRKEDGSGRALEDIVHREPPADLENPTYSFVQLLLLGNVHRNVLGPRTIECSIGKEQLAGVAATVFHSIFETHACGENRSDAAIFFGDVDSDYAAAVIGRQITRRAA